MTWWLILFIVLACVSGCCALGCFAAFFYTSSRAKQTAPVDEEQLLSDQDKTHEEGPPVLPTDQDNVEKDMEKGDDWADSSDGSAIWVDTSNGSSSIWEEAESQAVVEELLPPPDGPVDKATEKRAPPDMEEAPVMNDVEEDSFVSDDANPIVASNMPKEDGDDEDIWEYDSDGEDDDEKWVDDSYREDGGENSPANVAPQEREDGSLANEPPWESARNASDTIEDVNPNEQATPREAPVDHFGDKDVDNKVADDEWEDSHQGSSLIATVPSNNDQNSPREEASESQAVQEDDAALQRVERSLGESNDLLEMAIGEDAPLADTATNENDAAKIRDAEERAAPDTMEAAVVNDIDENSGEAWDNEDLVSEMTDPEWDNSEEGNVDEADGADTESFIKQEGRNDLAPTNASAEAMDKVAGRGKVSDNSQQHLEETASEGENVQEQQQDGEGLPQSVQDISLLKVSDDIADENYLKDAPRKKVGKNETSKEDNDDAVVQSVERSLKEATDLLERTMGEVEGREAMEAPNEEYCEDESDELDIQELQAELAEIDHRVSENPDALSEEGSESRIFEKAEQGKADQVDVGDDGEEWDVEGRESMPGEGIFDNQIQVAGL